MDTNQWIEVAFEITYPVYFLTRPPAQPCPYPPPPLCIEDDGSWAVALFTDDDLARRYLATARPDGPWVLVSLDDADELAYFCTKICTGGGCGGVLFDFSPASGVGFYMGWDEVIGV